ncbi:hypothetical protein CYMTET_44202 [Cymbomonas tetramitiformis]|uniref:Uncharacterized protein n=1 Tax=Cymbomonas tetramitiformis TaxID=36881 RepID=A0AAE0C0P9_9CHLO|nr:hypothetical protein CYMTET_44202 [Cymbomonas tetramitiformis]
MKLDAKTLTMALRFNPSINTFANGPVLKDKQGWSDILQAEYKQNLRQRYQVMKRSVVGPVAPASASNNTAGAESCTPVEQSASSVPGALAETIVTQNSEQSVATLAPKRKKSSPRFNPFDGFSDQVVEVEVVANAMEEEIANEIVLYAQLRKTILERYKNKYGATGPEDKGEDSDSDSDSQSE